MNTLVPLAILLIGGLILIWWLTGRITRNGCITSKGFGQKKGRRKRDFAPDYNG